MILLIIVKHMWYRNTRRIYFGFTLKIHRNTLQFYKV